MNTLDSIALTMAHFVGTVAYLGFRIGRVEKKFDEFARRETVRAGVVEQRLLVLEGRRATK